MAISNIYSYYMRMLLQRKAHFARVWKKNAKNREPYKAMK